MLRKILVATDFSDSSRSALHAALSLAKKCLGRIELIHVVTYVNEMYSFSRFGIPDWDLQKELNQKLNEFFPEAIYPNSHRQLIVGPSATREILKYANEQGCSLIVLGYHGHTALTKLLLGSVAAQVSRLSEIPVLIVKPVSTIDQQYQGFEKILVPIDFSDQSCQALEFGVRFANFLKADLHLVHVVDLPALQELKKNYPERRIHIDESSEWNVDLVLNKMLEGRRMVGETRVCTLTGDPALQIASYADTNRMNFIVMGTHGRKGVERLLMGSVTTGVIGMSEVPVITISNAAL